MHLVTVPQVVNLGPTRPPPPAKKVSSRFYAFQRVVGSAWLLGTPRILTVSQVPLAHTVSERSPLAQGC